MSSLTDNYGLVVPEPSDSMADVATYVTGNFTKLSTRADPTVILNGGALPQAGSYEVGDRVCRIKAAADATDYTSSYILVCKDANWGWHWRPVQTIMSPWVTLPATIFADANWSMNPVAPLQIALDSNGYLWWRGAMRYVSTTLPTGATQTIFKTMPRGIRSNTRHMHTLAVGPFPTGSTGIAGYFGGRIFNFGSDGTSSFRFFNTGTGPEDVWFTGYNYWPSDSYVVSP